MAQVNNILVRTKSLAVQAGVAMLSQTDKLPYNLLRLFQQSIVTGLEE